jgi:hypothetical protein
MAKRKKRTSIYRETIEDLNITGLVLDVLNESVDPDWQFNIHDSWDEKVQKALKELDFHQFDYYFRSNTYWCGVLMAEPFSELTAKYEEEEILNNIKDEHLKMVWTDDGLVLRFFNPTKSPLYRFFLKHQEDGYGLNVPTSVSGLIGKIEKYLRQEFQENLDSYGEWEPIEYEEEDVA